MSQPSAKPTERTPLVVSRFGPHAEGAEGSSLTKQIPAWVISGVVHVVFIAVMVLFFSSAPAKLGANAPPIIETAVEDVEEPDPNLTNPDLGFDAELDSATDADREEPENVEAEVTPEEPIGAPNELSEAPIQTVAPPGAGPIDDAPGVAGTDGGFAKGGGMGGTFMVPGMRGRSGATRDALLKAGGGNSESEAAVARGLAWLAAQQKSDGKWVFDGSSKDEFVAATGIALLPFLAAGETHKTGKLYTAHVGKGLKFLTDGQAADGRLGKNMYGHAIATIALCEAFGMTQDPNVKKSAQKAIDWCTKAQHAAGGWRYAPGMAGDTSVTGWYFQALTSGKLSGLVVPDAALKKVTGFLNSVEGNSGATYGYTDKGGGGRHFSMNAVGLLCRQYAGWGPKNPSIANGVKRLIDEQPPTNSRFDMYYYYYATQVVHFYGGPEWRLDWNPKMRDLLVARQVKAGGPDKGSWEQDRTITGSHGGRLITTCLSLLTLEVYYRHLPLYKRDTGGLNDIDR